MKNSDFIPNGKASTISNTDLATLLRTDNCTTCPLILAARTSGEPICSANKRIGGHNLSSDTGEVLKVPRMETITKVAEIFNLPVHFVRQKVNAGEVVAVRAGKKYLVNVDKFSEYLNGCTISQTAENTGGERLQKTAAGANSRIMPISLK